MHPCLNRVTSLFICIINNNELEENGHSSHSANFYKIDNSLYLAYFENLVAIS